MPVREPEWWYGAESSWQAALLAPVAAVVGRIASARLRDQNGYRSRLPVICVGNFTAGGSGKTPLALLLAKLVKEEGRAPWFLSRGYGGSASGAVLVDPTRHAAADVGDEPFLLAAHASAVVSRDRRKGAELIEQNATGPAAIIMDDGLQNPTLAKDLTIAVVDCARRFGNGRVIPAGPLRAPLAEQIRLANLIVLNGEVRSAASDLRVKLSRLTSAPIISASVRPTANADRFRSRKVIAYAGIANPGRFFSLLETLGAVVLSRHAFADHHPFSDHDARMLLEAAQGANAELITTEKDFARLASASGAVTELRAASSVLAIEAAIDGENLQTLKALLHAALSRQS
ncbi:tetraacyldisaccharide 4'-kinase [Hyphomicrobium methylovorum]|uniref:tetraacyldisaccharide 4'-kinase n=1 Tax=Hyphomicrobium methylovorum TaxID=84 RepID=UPI0015E71EA4|nr:tetraacyldisaccharide 4'-kinase [Hyphomicrobium methylovorum]MBA2126857.1 tetraacyldisaccharide 4'-kinase [Hyphomicrobium methylovorum]